MSIQHANRGIVKKDLQLYYNREYNGSFLGEATVNFFSIPAATLQKEGNHSTSFATSTSNGIPDLIVSGNKQVYYAPEYYTLVATGAWLAETNRLIIYPKYGSGNSSYAPGGTYRISFYARSLSGNTNLGFAFYGSSINNTATLTSKWQRFSANSTYSSAMIIEFGNINAGSMVCQIACIQVEAKSYATPFTVPVLWTPNLVNVTSTSGHTKITRGATNNGSWTQARIFSSEGYNEPCYVSFKASQTGCPIMVGLNSNPSSGINYANLDYVWYPTWDAGNPSYIYENGSPFGPYTAYTTSTIFEIIYDGVNVKYYMDGVLKYTSLVTPTLPLYLDSSFFSTSNGGSIDSLSFGPLSQINRFSNYVIGGGGLKDISGNNYNIDLTSSAIAFDSGGYYFNANAAGALTTPVANSILDSLSNNTHTYECWIKLLGTPPGASDGYFFGRQGFHEGYAQFKSPSTTFGALSWYFDNGNTGWLSYAGALNTWYHTAYVVDVENSIRYLYVNGVLNSSGALTKQLKQYSSGTVYQLGSANPDYASNSIVSNAKAYNRALTAAEVLQNFNATRKTYGI
tara:strand:+ start:376 stop:2085 length:1710 start_codon:yes stop_codon:yes gene_type:complete